VLSRSSYLCHQTAWGAVWVYSFCPRSLLLYSYLSLFSTHIVFRCFIYQGPFRFPTYMRCVTWWHLFITKLRLLVDGLRCGTLVDWRVIHYVLLSLFMPNIPLNTCCHHTLTVNPSQQLWIRPCYATDWDIGLSGDADWEGTMADWGCSIGPWA